MQKGSFSNAEKAPSSVLKGAPSLMLTDYN